MKKGDVHKGVFFYLLFNDLVTAWTLSWPPRKTIIIIFIGQAPFPIMTH